MHPTSALPFNFNWNPQQIADAVPTRLFELDLFADGDRAGQPANRPAARTLQRGYLQQRALPRLFRIHG
ncbi:hypothetical protein H0E84_04195 [Luteimonas sp. SJ-92]|uniref:Uncharacterized protein n=1 Tax=Luteimonas salinisoli TaxID=2752307 RepID=A0A853J8W2_9GAMM|nr:hypothetical protein [Luteimonas salinisoli]NZA25573.1 hypothetical protein [Luteimonas salinisoli]